MQARLRLTTVALCLVLLLGACSRSSDAQSAEPSGQTASLTIDQLPNGPGRGYAEAVTDDEPAATGGLPTVGSPAPNFRLVLADGRQLTLASLRGRPVMINFWATWCGPCRLEMPEIVKASKNHPELVVLAIDVQETRPVVEPFVEEFAMTMPVALDSAGAVRTLYQIRGMPTSIFIDREGLVAGIWSGFITPELLAEMLGKIL